MSPSLHVVGEALAVELVPVDDAVGPHGPRVAHVDHVRVGHVQADPEGHEEHQRHRQHRHWEVGNEPPLPLARPEACEQHPHQQIEQHRVDQRHRHTDLSPVEEHVRGPEGKQHEQVEVQQPQRPAEVDERQQEEQAQGKPDVGRVQGAPEGALAPAGHGPGHLIAPPLLEHGTRAVVHLDLRDLLAVTEEAHLPAAGAVGVGVGPQRPLPPLGPHLLRPLGDARDLARAAVVVGRRLGLGLRRLEVGRLGGAGSAESGQRRRAQRRSQSPGHRVSLA